MSKRDKIVLGVLFLLLAVLGISTKVMAQNYDVRGFSLSAREAALAIAGGNHSFLFELREGDYEFKLYRFQNGNLVEEHIFAGGGAVIDDRKPEGLQVHQNRNLVTVNATDFETGTWAWSLGTEMLSLGKGITVTEIEGQSRGWGSIQRSLRLEDVEVPLLYIAFTDGRFPSALENIVTGQFNVHEDADQFNDVADLFIVTIRRIN